MLTHRLIESYARQPRAERRFVDAEVVYGAKQMGEGPFTLDDVIAKHDAIKPANGSWQWGDPMPPPGLTREQQWQRAELKALMAFMRDPANIQALEAFARVHPGATRALGE